MRYSLLLILAAFAAGCVDPALAPQHPATVDGTPLSDEEPIAEDSTLEPMIYLASVQSSLSQPQYPDIATTAEVTAQHEAFGTFAGVYFQPQLSVRGEPVAINPDNTAATQVAGPLQDYQLSINASWQQSVSAPCQVSLGGDVQFTVSYRISLTSSKNTQIGQQIPSRLNRTCILPVAHLTTSGMVAGQESTLDGSSSEACHNSTCGMVSYSWEVDGSPAGSEEQITYTFPDTGHYYIRLTVTNTDGLSDSESASLLVYSASDLTGCTIEQQRIRSRFSLTKPTVLADFSECSSGGGDPAPELGGRGEDGIMVCYDIYLTEWEWIDLFGYWEYVDRYYLRFGMLAEWRRIHELTLLGALLNPPFDKTS